MLYVSAPGKLFISGEWAILETGSSGIVAAVDRRVHAWIDDADEGMFISIEDFGIKDIFLKYENKKFIFSEKITDEQKEKLKFLLGSIEVSLIYLAEKGIHKKPFSITTRGDSMQIEVGGEYKKIGFGSSASTAVSVVAAVLAFHEYEASEEEIFKLASISHFFSQGKIGSSFDVAASTYGSIFIYSRFDVNWLLKEMEEKVLRDVVNQEWPGLIIEKLEIPDDLNLIIGWTKKSASTSEMVTKMGSFKKENKDEYDKLMAKISEIAANAIKSWKHNKKKELLETLRKNEDALRELGEKSGVEIETEELKMLSEIANKHGGAGKLSGAGGGDCGIAICFDNNTASKIKHGWESEGFYVVDTGIAQHGVKIENA